ncbi:FIST N-terminal domain-containing protein [Niveibacterium terrae]|uniref:FIST N-terminal domain-containing protein n=1 Tax=Niveibacterium terrae TaxID=3373598 RepID=UPI003A9041D5
MPERAADHVVQGPRIGQTCLRSTPEAAAAELAAQLEQPGLGLVLLFLGDIESPERFCTEFSARLRGASVLGVSAAAEIGPQGYLQHSVAGVSFRRNDLPFAFGVLESLSTANLRKIHHFTSALIDDLRMRSPAMTPANSFALMMIEGTSERIAHAFHDGLDGLRLIGGTASTAQADGQTRLFVDGRLVRDAAALIVASTGLPFRIFKAQHYSAGDPPLVVTGAIPEQRIVTELNGLPAAREYARAIGLDPAAICTDVFATRPLICRLGNNSFIRSIRFAAPEGALTFFCSVEEGTVLRPAVRKGMTESLSDTFADIRASLGEPSVTLGFDCVLRRTEMIATGSARKIERILMRMKMVGFSTFGEQYCGMHINQTMTGITFGKPNPR